MLAIGGATNLAIMLQRYPGSMSLRCRAVFMGGALKVAGNVNAFNPDYTNTSAEWNFFVDPIAAAVLASSVATIEQQGVYVATELNEEMDNSGAIVPIYDGPAAATIQVATSLTMSVAEFQADFITTLNAAP